MHEVDHEAPAEKSLHGVFCDMALRIDEEDLVLGVRARSQHLLILRAESSRLLVEVDGLRQKAPGLVVVPAPQGGEPGAEAPGRLALAARRERRHEHVGDLAHQHDGGAGPSRGFEYAVDVLRVALRKPLLIARRQHRELFAGGGGEGPAHGRLRGEA